MLMIHSLKSRLFIIFGSLLIAILSIGSLMVFHQMKTLIIEKNIEVVQRVAHTGVIPLADAMVSQSMGKTLPIGFIDHILTKLRNESDQKIYYAKFISHDGQFVIASSSDKEWVLTHNAFSFNPKIYLHQNRWIVEAVEHVAISTKTWGYLVLGFEADSIQAEVMQVLWGVYMVVGLFIFIMLFVVAIISESLTRRLNQLSAAVGQFNLYPVDDGLPDGNDEIGQLSDSFKKLRQRLIRSRANLKESERNVFHAEKLASIGRLAAGVAHEINNPLTGIRHSINNILKDDVDKKERHEYLRLIDDALKNIESVISKLLGFSRRKGDELFNASINEAILTVSKLLEYSIKSKNIHFETNLYSNIPAIRCDPHLLDEISMNLIMNAIDASDDGGKIVCTSTYENEKIFFSIEDWGHGISQQDISKIFDPFFTTKDVGKGTGLGLYVTQEVVRGLGGEINLTTQPDSGTKFTIQFPANTL